MSSAPPDVPGSPKLTGRLRMLPRAVPAAGAGLATAVLTLLQLFVGGTAGMADNGDATRLMCRLGLQIGPGSSQQTFESTYGAVATCPAGGFYQYDTSWRAVVHATVWAYRLLTGSTGFDVAALGVVCALLLGAGVAALVLALPGPGGRRALLVALVVVAVCDFGFVAYFNSGYSDPAGLIGLPFVLAGVVGLVGRRTLPWLVVLVAAAAFTSTAKTQLAPGVVVVAVVLLLTHRRWARPPERGLRIRWPRITTGLALAVVVAAAGWFAKGQGESFSRGNKFNMLFYTLLPDSADPARTLQELGLPTALARFSGTGAWEVTTPYGDPDVVANSDRIFSWSTYAHHLLQHPGEAWTMVRRSFDAVLGARVDYLGNLPGEPGGPVQLADRPSPVFWLLGHLPVGWPVPVLALVWLVGAGLGLWWIRSADPGRTARGVLALTTVGWAASQSLVALSDGYYELAKHNIHAAFATAILLAVLLESALGAAVGAVAERRRRRRGPGDHGGTAAGGRAPTGTVVGGQDAVEDGGAAGDLAAGETAVRGRLSR